MTSEEGDRAVSADDDRAGPGFAVVGIGASAGGLAALEAFFAAVDDSSAMAFVVVQHLAPDHESMLAPLIQRYTSMGVEQARDGTRVEPGHVYVIPPDRDITIEGRVLRLTVPEAPRGHRAAIDAFFTSLAQDQGAQAVAVVLSGTGNDGSLGIRAVKGEAGMVMAQLPDSAEFDGMPRSAIATGLTDFVLPPAQLAAALQRYVRHRFAGGDAPDPAPPAASEEDTTPSQGLDERDALHEIFDILERQTGHDFHGYKQSTVQRRVRRRMAIRLRDGIDDYLSLLREEPDEAESLFQDLLIGVTRFFRDPAAFAAVAQWLPRFLHGRSRTDTFRVWVVGCSTGEEAYSLAILVREWLEQNQREMKVQIFASDIDARAIAAARAGIYPASIAADVSAERLERFFVREQEGTVYRVSSRVRELIVFSEHDVLRDPPFSRLDFISCRNVLIYLDASAQQQILPVFHYALNSGGVLLLGASESVGSLTERFEPLDRYAKLYRRVDDETAVSRAPRRIVHGARTVRGEMARAATQPPSSKASPHSLRDLTERALLDHAGLVGMLVGADGALHYLHGKSGRYLEPAAGPGGQSNAFEMAREGLRSPLIAAVRQAALGRGEQVRSEGLRVKTNGDFTMVDLTARTSSAPSGEQYVLVVLEDHGVTSPAALDAPEPSSGDQTAEALRRELRDKEEHLLATQEEMQTANEESQSSNEELQSINEELQSTNEELETSKEELQSVNEELSTVNTELQSNVAQLSRANNDLKNLLASTDIGTIFLDTELRIQRFTPALRALINVIDGDIGRPLGHIASNLVGYAALVADAQAVLETLETKEIEVESTSGAFYLLRIRPYRTTDNAIEGVVITFTDVTMSKRARGVLVETETLRRLAAVVQDSRDAIAALDLDGVITAWNRSAEQLYGWSESEAIGKNVRDTIPTDGRADWERLLHALSHGHSVHAKIMTRLRRDGALIRVEMTATPLVNARGETYALSTTDREISK